VEEGINLVNMEAVYKNIEIVREIAPDKNTIWSDPSQLRQVLINLLTNAIYATNVGGKITIRLEAMDETITLIVQDTGQGIPKENLNKIFEPFFSTKPPGEGTGLGLFVTRGIVEKLGGIIEVTSKLGNGASFYIMLPRYFKIKKDLDQDERIQFLEHLAEQSNSTQ